MCDCEYTTQTDSKDAENSLLGGALIKAGGAVLASGLAIGRAATIADAMHLGHGVNGAFNGIADIILPLHHLHTQIFLRFFAVGNAFVGGYMIGSGINTAVPYLRSGQAGRDMYDFTHPNR